VNLRKKLKNNMERYIKIYEKAIEFGRDVGYSGTDYMTFTNIEDLARSFGKHFNERYFT
jgi:predicted flavoprotein YhiN